MCVRATRARRLVPDFRLVCKISRLLASPGAFWPSLSPNPQILEDVKHV